MKRVSLIAVLLLAGTLSIAEPQDAAKAVGVVCRVNGIVEVTVSGAPAKESAVVGKGVLPGHRFIASKGSSATIVLRSGKVVRVGPDSTWTAKPMTQPVSAGIVKAFEAVFAKLSRTQQVKNAGGRSTGRSPAGPALLLATRAWDVPGAIDVIWTVPVALGGMQPTVDVYGAGRASAVQRTLRPMTPGLFYGSCILFRARIDLPPALEVSLVRVWPAEGGAPARRTEVRVGHHADTAWVRKLIAEMRGAGPDERLALAHLLEGAGFPQAALEMYLVVLVEEPRMADAHASIAELFASLKRDDLAAWHLAILENIRG